MKRTIKIEGMSCNHCVISVKKSLSKLNLNNIKVEVGSAEVEFDENKVEEEDILKAIEDNGYHVVK